MNQPKDAGGWRDDRWMPWFLISLAAAAGALAALAWVSFAAVSDDPPADVVAPPVVDATSTPGSDPGRLLRVWIDPATGYALPEGLNVEEVVLAEAADVTIVAEGETAFTSRMFVPVAAMFAGVDTLSAEQLRGLLAGGVTDWADV
ncbi:MAG: hypothetical protein WEC33_02995, partial [Dehalococcoidia bacterium]